MTRIGLVRAWRYFQLIELVLGRDDSDTIVLETWLDRNLTRVNKISLSFNTFNTTLIIEPDMPNDTVEEA